MRDLPNPNPTLLYHLSKRLRKHIGQPEKNFVDEPPTNTGVTLSISAALKAQISEYRVLHRTQQPKLSISSVLQSAVTAFVNAQPPHECPVKFTPSTKFARRARVIGFSLPVGVHEELQAFAHKNRLTVVAVVRRAAYEYTKPEAPDPVATLDAWGDREK